MIAKMQKVKWEKVYFWACILFVLSVCLWNIGMYQRVRVVDDEFAYWGIAAQLAGLDWSGALSHTGYYSYGYSFILVPFYWLIRLGADVVLIYRIVIGLNAVFVCLSFTLAVMVGKMLFKNTNIFLIQSAALVSAVNLASVYQASCAWTEVYLTFMFWCCTYCVIRTIYKPEKKWIIFSLLTAANLFAIHMRTVAVCLVVVGVVWLRLFLAEKKIKWTDLIGTVLLTVILAAAVLEMRDFVKDSIYMNNAATVTNDFAGQTQKIAAILSMAGIVDFVLSICGKIFYIASSTYCLGAFAVMIGIRQVMQGGFEWLTRKVRIPEKEWFVHLFLVGSAAGAVCVDAVFKIVRYYSERATGSKGDAVIYGRYVDFVVGPLMLFGVLYLLEEFRKYRWELFLSVILVIGCGLASQHVWDILLYYSTSGSITMRETAFPGLIHIISGAEERLAYLLIVWTVAGLLLLLLPVLCEKPKNKWILTVGICSVATVYFGFVGHQKGQEWVLGKAHKNKNVDSIVSVLEQTDMDTEIYYVSSNAGVHGDMKILQWEIPLRTINVISCQEDAVCMQEENAVYLAESSDAQLNARLCDEGGIYLYDSGSMAVYVKDGSGLDELLKDSAKAAAACADQKEQEVDLAYTVQEFSYQKENGNIYLSDQRTEAYLTGTTGLKLGDGIYRFLVSLELSYYENGDIGYITITNDKNSWLDTRILESGDFDASGKAVVAVDIPVRNYEEPVIGVYTYGNGAMKVTGMTCKQISGNTNAAFGRDDEWKELAEILSGVYADCSLPISFVDADSSAQNGFPDFSEVNVWMPDEITGYHTLDQIRYMKNMKEQYLIMEIPEEGDLYIPDRYEMIYSNEYYYILMPQG